MHTANGLIALPKNTLGEEFGCHMRHLLFKEMSAFNAKFIAWLAWYHRERPHYAHKQLSPNPVFTKTTKVRKWVGICMILKIKVIIFEN